MSNVQNFIYITEQKVRVIMVENEPWFIGSDVCKILGYVNVSDALRAHVDKEDKNTIVIYDGIRGNPNKTIINEAGIYSLIFSSKKPEAKKFKNWVTREVLPSIRKTGQYIDTENKFEQNCPVEFGKEELTDAMRINCKKVGGQKNGGLAWYYKYMAFGDKIGVDFYHDCKKKNIRPVDWLRSNNYYENFCEFVCTQQEQGSVL